MQTVIALRRENKNVWERRVGLTPSDCKVLIEQGIKVLVQPDKLRCFKDEEYSGAGAVVTEDITTASIVIGIKEVPLEYLYDDKTYLFYSHTIKGQPSNMPALRQILHKNIRLIDYELIHKEGGKSDISSSRFAGLVGAIDILNGIGKYMLFKRLSTPFLYAGFAYMFPRLDDVKESIHKIGNHIAEQKLPDEICPFVVAFISNGKVSKGSQEIWSILPHEYINCDDLVNLFISKQYRNDRVYLTVIEHKNMFIHKDTGQFSREDFYESPQNYKSVFAEKFAKYLNVIMNCLYWDSKFPKILTLEECKHFTQKGEFRINAISDITCDINGSIELLQKYTSIEKPFYLIDSITNQIEDDFNNITQTSVLYHAVDHLPAELPLDCSIYFSKMLLPVVQDLVKSHYPVDMKTGLKELPEEIQNAIETWNGQLSPKYKYLYRELGKYFTEYKDSIINYKF
jgi:alpha-aminoadipic semialdehyde synthase